MPAESKAHLTFILLCRANSFYWWLYWTFPGTQSSQNRMQSISSRQYHYGNAIQCSRGFPVRQCNLMDEIWHLRLHTIVDLDWHPLLETSLMSCLNAIGETRWYWKSICLSGDEMSLEPSTRQMAHTAVRVHLHQQQRLQHRWRYPTRTLIVQIRL